MQKEKDSADNTFGPVGQRFIFNGASAQPMFRMESDVRFACHGGCPKDRFVATPAGVVSAAGESLAGEPGLNYLCPGFKAFFHHVDAPMRRMCELLRDDRAPAEIVQEYAERRP